MKKILTVVAFAVAGLIVGLSALFWYLGRDIAEPDVSDFVVDRPVISVNENAFTYFVSVTNTAYLPDDSAFIVDFLDGSNVPMNEVDEAIAKNEKAFAEIVKGNKCKRCISPEIYSFFDRITYIAPWRNIGRIMAAKIRRDRLAQDYVQAVNTSAALLRYGYLIQTDAECLINYLVGLAILDMAFVQVQELILDDGIPVSELERLKDSVYGVSSFESGLHRAMKTEFNATAKIIDQFARGEFDLDDVGAVSEPVAPAFLRKKRYTGYFFKPNETKLIFAEFYRDVFKNMTSCYANMDFLDIEEILQLRKSRVRQLISPNSIGKILCSMMLPSTSSVLERKCRAEWRVSSTRLLIALQEFENDNGRLPEKVEDLVPEYIDAIPRDPFDGRPIRYESGKGIIYSVGRDLKDDGGARCRENHYGRSCSGASSLHNPDLVLEIK